MSELNHPKRIAWFDYLRILAMLAVVAQHVFGGANMSTQYHSVSLIQLFAATNIVRFNVPIFIMISGSFLLKPEKQFNLKNHVFRVLVALVATTIVYSVGNIVLQQHFFTAGNILTVLKDIAANTGGDHLWYLYMLIGLYFITPILKQWLSIAPEKQIQYILGVLFFFCSILPSISYFVKIKIAFSFPIEIIFVFYYLLGYYFCTKTPKHTPAIYLSAAVVFAVITVLEGVYFKVLMPFQDTAVVLMTVSLFLAFQATKNLKETKIVSLLSRCSFGVYLIHNIFVHIMFQALNLNLKLILNSFILTNTVYTLTVTILSTVLIWIALKIPFVRKFI